MDIMGARIRGELKYEWKVNYHIGPLSNQSW